jgi:hypothetical protein
MSTGNRRTQERITSEIEAERAELLGAVADLRRGFGEAADLNAKLRPRLPALAVGAVGAGFVVAGGIGALVRLLPHRGGADKPRPRFGRFTIVDRR